MRIRFRPSVYIISITIILIIQGCGIVSKTVHPNYNIRYYANLHRNLIVFAPNGSKVYYTMGNQPEQLVGYITNNQISSNIDAAISGFREFSSWLMPNEVDARIYSLFESVNDEAPVTLSIRVSYKNENFYRYEDCIYGIGLGCGNSNKKFTDLSVVRQVIDDSQSSDMNYTHNYKYTVYYRDLVIDFSETIKE